MDLNDALEVYQREVSKLPAQNAAEETRCVEHIRASNEMAEAARQQLVEAHLGRVIELARIHHKDGAHILDLIEHGNRGLMAAVQEAGQLTNGRFWEFAKPFVEKQMADLVLWF